LSNLIKKEGFDYAFEASACDNCAGNCCIGESGYIWITLQEIAVLAKHLNITQEELREQYLNKIGYKYSIKEVKLAEDNFACVFFNLEKRQCSVYEARPTQCRTFPFWDYFKENTEEVYKECPAIRTI
jgi:uncharacterized protein